ncbi:MAG TPA: hypothetical protein PLT76_03385 [Candidatus Omnitrophota bacterium]|nr:hypothetical protein [Candidatus Omnitrophota bacterium]HPB68029.1 hypothetical protein [Candidatus Omnitrophota bacterium]HQO57744.1 hypothetical protein [Candidatus Omnitrophota bacterium]HQP12659.1 hypothetical protein [Candidatus Omnitrophota bacterium]
MMKALRIIVLWASLAVWAGGAVFADELMDSAEAFFKSYVDGGNQASASVVNYFADDARIIAVRHLPEGGTVRIETTGEKHKKMLRKTRLRARASKISMQALTTFSDIAYDLEDGCVRVTAVRHVSPRQTTTPYSLLICRKDDKDWCIKEEIIELKQIPDVPPAVEP